MIIVIFFTSTFWSTFLAARANETGGPVINWYMVSLSFSLFVTNERVLMAIRSRSFGVRRDYRRSDSWVQRCICCSA